MNLDYIRKNDIKITTKEYIFLKYLYDNLWVNWKKIETEDWHYARPSYKHFQNQNWFDDLSNRDMFYKLLNALEKKWFLLSSWVPPYYQLSELAVTILDL